MDIQFPLHNLETIFNATPKLIFIVPSYQRGYAWTNTHRKELWDDIDSLSGKHRHFTGALMLREQYVSVENSEVVSEQESPIRALEIIDGQQRLTTLLILLSVIRDHPECDEEIAKLIQNQCLFVIDEQTGEEHCRLSYEHQKSNNFFKVKILGDSTFDTQYADAIVEENTQQADAIAEEKKHHTYYLSELKKAKDYYTQAIRSYNTPEKLKNLYDTIMQKLVFLVYQVDESLDENTIFETMNYRGKPLTKLEILKNRLLYLIKESKSIQPVEKQKLKKLVSESWQTIYEDLARDKDFQVPDDELLKVHWFMYRKDPVKQKEWETELFENLFSKKDLHNTVISLRIKKYVRSLTVSAKFFFWIRKPDSLYAEDSLPEGVREILQRIQYLYKYSYAEPLLLSLFHKFYSGESGIKEEDRVAEHDGLLTILHKIERHHFIVVHLYGDAKVHRLDFYKIASTIYNEPEEFDEQMREFDALIMNSVANTKIKKGKTRNSGEDLSKAFSIVIEDLDNSNKLYDSWEGMKYVLYLYEKKLFEEKRKENLELRPKVTWSTFKDAEIDHIIPEVYKKETPPAWKHVGVSGPDRRRRTVQTLGNLVLSLKPQNEPNRKFFCIDGGLSKQEYQLGSEMRGYKHGTYSEQELCSHQEWGHKQVYERSLALLAFIEEEWNVRFPKKDILPLTYVNFDNVSGDGSTSISE
jgi:uncharacterized protein with ParB-like and HNH nuclease domain